MDAPIKRPGMKVLGQVPGEYVSLYAFAGRAYVKTEEVEYLVTNVGLAPITRPDYTKPIGLN